MPDDLQDAPGRDYVQLTGPAAAERGEPWRTFLRPADIAALMDACGFGPVAHVRQRDVGGGELWRRTDALRPAGLFRLAGAQVRPAS